MSTNLVAACYAEMEQDRKREQKVKTQMRRMKKYIKARKRAVRSGS